MRQQSHRISAVERLPEILPYCEPDDSPWAPRIEPLLLCAIDGLSHADAALALGISPKAVETRLYRARARLAEALKASPLR